MRWRPTLRGLFLAERPDVLAMLGRQAEITVAGLEAFAAWSARGEDEQARAVRAAEHDADEARRTLLDALSTALTTPVDQEDLYTLSERLDGVLNGAKNIVREAEVLRFTPDEHAAKMGELARAAVAELAAGLAELGRRHERAGEHADAAIKLSRGIEREYRHALASLPPEIDVKDAIVAHEIYGGYTIIAEAVVRVCTRLRYALLKDA